REPLASRDPIVHAWRDPPADTEWGHNGICGVDPRQVTWKGQAVSYRAKKAIVERIEAIAAWREEREFQDMLGLGPEAAARSRQSAKGIRELAAHIDRLPDDDGRIDEIGRASCRERVEIPVVAGSLKKKEKDEGRKSAMM